MKPLRPAILILLCVALALLPGQPKQLD